MPLAFPAYRRRLVAVAQRLRHSPRYLDLHPPIWFPPRIPSVEEWNLHVRHAGNDIKKMEDFHPDYNQCVCHTWQDPTG